MFLQNTPSAVATTNVATTLDSILFDVESKPLWFQAVSSDGEPHEKQSSYNAIVRCDTNEELYAGREYELVHNSVIAEGIASFQDWRVSKVINNNDRQFHIIMKNDKAEPGILRNGDVEFPYSPQMTIKNSYDGSLAFGIFAGINIQICGNGAIVGGEALSFKHKHTQGLINYQDIIERFKATERNFGKIQEIINKKVWSKDNEVVKKMFFALIKGIPNHAKAPSPTSVTLQQRYLNEANSYGHGEFALMMAVTNITTYPESYGISNSYWQILSRNQSILFDKNGSN